MSINPTRHPEWQALQDHQDRLSKIPLSQLFEIEAARPYDMSVVLEGALLDFSKNRLDAAAFKSLMDLARAQNLEKWRDKMFAGEEVNHTEKRAVLHTAMREPEDRGLFVGNENTFTETDKVRQRMYQFEEELRSGQRRGYTGKKIRHIVNIGIGGSHLGPEMATNALRRHHKPEFECRFISNVDGADIEAKLGGLDPEETLFIVASKTFTTQETMHTAQKAKHWVSSHMGDDKCVKGHFIALSTNEDAVKDFGIHPDNMFPFKDYIGGRFSLWSPIGMSILLATGRRNFEQLLAGGHAMDTHFKTAPLEKNIPVIMGMTGIWHRNFWNYGAHAVLPYAQDLNQFPSFLKQLDMESNGKSVDRQGNRITDYQTGPVVFGAAGTNGQHAFYQHLHQSTSVTPADFIGFHEPLSEDHEGHELLLNNMFAQSEALMDGRTLEEAGGDPNRVFEGNRPSNTLLFPRLDPFNMGMLIALYEHRTAVQGFVWNINSFDQFGVELGKEKAKNLESGEKESDNPSTRRLIEHRRAMIPR